MAGNRRLEIVLVSLIVVLGALYARAEYIPPHAERHVELAAEKYDIDLGEPNRWFSAWSVGDGQAFAVIAADPSGEKLSKEIKEPIYRFSRAGYGWLSAAMSLGRDAWIPYGMALAGAVALAGNLWLAIYLRRSIGPRAWFLVLNPALYIGFAGDTAEPLALLALAFGLASGAVWATLILAVTRPSYLLALITRGRQFSYGVATAVALAIYGILRFGTDDLVPDGGRLDIPLRAYFENASVAGWVLVGLAFSTLIVGFMRKDWSWVLSGLLVLSFGSDVTLAVENAWRAGGMLAILWTFGPNYATISAVSDSPSAGTLRPAEA